MTAEGAPLSLLSMTINTEDPVITTAISCYHQRQNTRTDDAARPSAGPLKTSAFSASFSKKRGKIMEKLNLATFTGLPLVFGLHFSVKPQDF